MVYTRPAIYLEFDELQTITTPPVLRWKDGWLLFVGNRIAYTIGINNGYQWETLIGEVLRGGFCDTEQEARRAAEKALGFPDGLVIEEV